jgi:hypothetical protein
LFWIARTRIIFIVSSILFCPIIQAAEIDVTGYATVLAGYTDEKEAGYSNSLATNHVSFTNKSLAGLQFNAEMYENVDFSLTLLMEGADEYIAHTDWFYITYTATQNTSFRFGRLKVPFFMVSNYIDIGHAYPWVSPPPEVYNVKMAKSADGLEYIFDTDLLGGTLMFDLYMGTGKHHQDLSASFIHDPNVNTGSTYKTGDKINYELHDLVGFETSISSETITFRIGHYQTKFNTDDFNIENSEMKFYSTGLIIDWKKFLLYSEYITRESEDDVQFLFPDQKSKYITLGFKISDFLPYVTYATIDKGKNKNKYGVIQESTSLGIRYNFNSRMDIKFQASKITTGKESGDIGRFGLFDQEIGLNDEPIVYTMSLDILF